MKQIAVIALCSIVLGLASCSSRDVEYYTTRMKDPQSNLYYLARRTAELGDPGVRWLLEDTSGTYDGDWEEVVGIALRYAPCDVTPYLDPMLRDEDPHVRGFAARVVGHLLDERFTPQLNGLTNDTAAMPNLWFDETVADCARGALRAFEHKRKNSEDFRRAQELIDETTSTP